MHFVPCPKHRNKIEDIVLGRACINKTIFCRKLGQVSNPQWLTYTQILVEYQRKQKEAETHTILKTKKPLGRGEILRTRKIRHVTAISREQKVTTAMAEQARFVRFSMLNRVLPVHRRQRNNNWTRQKKRQSHLFLLFRKAISPFRVINTPTSSLMYSRADAVKLNMNNRTLKCTRCLIGSKWS